MSQSLSSTAAVRLCFTINSFLAIHEKLHSDSFINTVRDILDSHFAVIAKCVFTGIYEIESISYIPLAIMAAVYLVDIIRRSSPLIFVIS